MEAIGSYEQLSGQLQDISNKINSRVTAAANGAFTAGQQDPASLKRQLQALKSSILNLGQKDAFADAMRQYQMGADVKADIARTSQAVDNAEEELKEWKKANREDEQHVKQVVQTIAGLHEQFKAVQARTQAKLQEPADTILSLASARAGALESQLAAALESRTAQEHALLAEQANISVLQAAVAEAQAADDGVARLEQQAKWLEGAVELLASITGVTSVRRQPLLAEGSGSVSGGGQGICVGLRHPGPAHGQKTDYQLCMELSRESVVVGGLHLLPAGVVDVSGVVLTAGCSLHEVVCAVQACIASHHARL